MYDINFNNLKKGKKIYYVFLLFGILFLGIMVFVFVNNQLKAKRMDASVLSTKVEVSDYIDDEGSIMYSPKYYYVVKGKEYICDSSYSSASYPSSDNKLIYYNSNNPSDCVSEFSKKGYVILLAFMLLPVIFIAIAIYNFVKINKRIAAIKYLNDRGKLVKNLPYRLENTNITVNNTEIKKIVVDYTLPDGTTKTLYSDPRYDNVTADQDGMVDLVIDELNPDNYFIDFDINRKLGNTSSDYYKQSSTSFNSQINNQNNIMN